MSLLKRSSRPRLRLAPDWRVEHPKDAIIIYLVPETLSTEHDANMFAAQITCFVFIGFYAYSSHFAEASWLVSGCLCMTAYPFPCEFWPPLHARHLASVANASQTRSLHVCSRAARDGDPGVSKKQRKPLPDSLCFPFGFP